MTSGVEGNRCAANLAVFSVADGVEGDITKTVPHDRGGGLGCQVGGMAGAGVIGVAVRDERALHGAPRIDVEIASGAVDTGFGEAENHVSELSVLVGVFTLLFPA